MERTLECAPVVAGSVVARRAQRAVATEGHALELDGRVVPAGVERGRGAGSDRGCGDHEETDAAVDPGRDGQLVGGVTVEHVVLGSLEAPAVPGRSGRHTEVGGRRAAGAARRGQGAGDATVRDGAQEAGSLLRRARVAHDGHELRGGREEGAGGDDAPELLHDHPQLDEPEPHASVVGGHRETGPAERDHVLPERVSGFVALDGGPHHADRALAGQERAHGRAQRLLLLCELQLHPSVAARRAPPARAPAPGH